MDKCLPNEEVNRQHEAEQFTTPEPGCFPRSIGMNFDMADILSIDESDDESSDPLPLGTGPQNLFYIFYFPFITLYFFLYSVYQRFKNPLWLRLIPHLLVASKLPSLDLN